MSDRFGIACGVSKPQEGASRISEVFISKVIDNDKANHPAIFPPTLVDQLIKMFSSAGDLVRPPLAASGTTLLVAPGLGRRAAGIELEREYVKLIQDRLDNEFWYRSQGATLDQQWFEAEEVP